MSERLLNDVDPIETRDWQQAIESVIREEGVERAQYLTSTLLPLKMNRNTRVIWSWSVVFVLLSAGTPS